MTIDVQVRGASKRYRRGWALRDCDMTVTASSITAIVGPNGAGKSTLLSATVGLRYLTAGEITVGGRPVDGRINPQVGYLAQDKPLYRRWRVSDMLAQTSDLNTNFDLEHARRLIDQAGLSLKARVDTLSGGQRTRLALALVLGRRPALVLLDEPFADLDPLSRLNVQQMLLAQASDTGMTVVMSSHILTEVQDTCDELQLMQDGHVTLHGNLDDLIDSHRILTGPAEDSLDWLPAADQVEVRRTARQVNVMVSVVPMVLPDRWTAEPVDLNQIVIARLRKAEQEVNTQRAAS